MDDYEEKIDGKIVHRISREVPSQCVICGKENRKLIAWIQYRNEYWFTVNFCSEKCLKKSGLPVKKIIRKKTPKSLISKSLYTSIKGLTFSIKEYTIPDQIEINTKIFQ